MVVARTSHCFEHATLAVEVHLLKTTVKISICNLRAAVDDLAKVVEWSGSVEPLSVPYGRNATMVGHPIEQKFVSSATACQYRGMPAAIEGTVIVEA